MVQWRRFEQQAKDDDNINYNSMTKVQPPSMKTSLDDYNSTMNDLNKNLITLKYWSIVYISMCRIFYIA